MCIKQQFLDTYKCVSKNSKMPIKQNVHYWMSKINLAEPGGR